MITKVRLLGLLLLLVFCTVTAQESFMFYDIQKAKQSDAAFQDISTSVIKTNVDKNMLQKQFINGNEIGVIEYTPAKGKKLGNALYMTVPLKSKDAVLEVIETPASYEVETSDGQRYPANKEIRHYRGIVRGQPNSIVALTFYKDEIMGLVATNDGNFNIAKDKSSGKHLIFLESNLKEKQHSDCVTPDYSNDWDGHTNIYDQEMLLEEFSASKIFAEQAVKSIQATAASSSGKIVRLHIETEYDIYDHYKNIGDVEAYISGLMNQVRALYANEDISMYLYHLLIWTSEDPYNASNPVYLLPEYSDYRGNSSLNGDLGMLLTFRSSNNNNVGMAHIDGLCDSELFYRVAVGFISNSYEIVPTYSLTVFIITHELGHSLGSRHTHACVWNGNYTAIDGCGSVEGSCTQPPKPPLNSGQGTIMSYCHSISVGVGTNFANGFGTQPGNVIRNKVRDASCLIGIIGPNTVPCISGTASYSLPSSIPIPTWTVSSNLQIISGQGTRTINVKAKQSTSGTISGTVTATFTSFGQSTSLSKTVSILQPPTVTSITGPSTVQSGGYGTFNASPVFPAAQGDYEWYVNPSAGTHITVYRQMCDITFNNIGTYTVYCRSKNNCNSPGSYNASKTVTVGSAGYYSAIVPNNSKLVNITYSAKPGSTLSKQTVDYSLTNTTTGRIVSTGHLPATGGTLDFSAQPAGIYILQITTDKGEVETFKLVFK